MDPLDGSRQSSYSPQPRAAPHMYHAGGYGPALGSPHPHHHHQHVPSPHHFHHHHHHHHHHHQQLGGVEQAYGGYGGAGGVHAHYAAFNGVRLVGDHFAFHQHHHQMAMHGQPHHQQALLQQQQGRTPPSATRGARNGNGSIRRLPAPIPPGLSLPGFDGSPPSISIGAPPNAGFYDPRAHMEQQGAWEPPYVPAPVGGMPHLLREPESISPAPRSQPNTATPRSSAGFPPAAGGGHSLPPSPAASGGVLRRGAGGGATTLAGVSPSSGPADPGETDLQGMGARRIGRLDGETPENKRVVLRMLHQKATAMKNGENLEGEEDAHRVMQRHKQILFGKVTSGYRRYAVKVPTYMRREGNMYHPDTPRPETRCSKRRWDLLMQIWRRELHLWDSPMDRREYQLMTAGVLDYDRLELVDVERGPDSRPVGPDEIYEHSEQVRSQLDKLAARVEDAFGAEEGGGGTGSGSHAPQPLSSSSKLVAGAFSDTGNRHAKHQHRAAAAPAATGEADPVQCLLELTALQFRLRPRDGRRLVQDPPIEVEDYDADRVAAAAATDGSVDAITQSGSGAHATASGSGVVVGGSSSMYAYDGSSTAVGGHSARSGRSGAFLADDEQTTHATSSQRSEFPHRHTSKSSPEDDDACAMLQHSPPAAAAAHAASTSRVDTPMLVDEAGLGSVNTTPQGLRSGRRPPGVLPLSAVVAGGLPEPALQPGSTGVPHSATLQSPAKSIAMPPLSSKPIALIITGQTFDKSGLIGGPMTFRVDCPNGGSAPEVMQRLVAGFNVSKLTFHVARASATIPSFPTSPTVASTAEADPPETEGTGTPRTPPTAGNSAPPSKIVSPAKAELPSAASPGSPTHRNTPGPIRPFALASDSRLPKAPTAIRPNSARPQGADATAKAAAAPPALSGLGPRPEATPCERHAEQCKVYALDTLQNVYYYLSFYDAGLPLVYLDHRDGVAFRTLPTGTSNLNDWRSVTPLLGENGDGASPQHDMMMFHSAVSPDTINNILDSSHQHHQGGPHNATAERFFQSPTPLVRDKLRDLQTPIEMNTSLIGRPNSAASPNVGPAAAAAGGGSQTRALRSSSSTDRDGSVARHTASGSS